jgi:2-keto-4-pentenoate hydratase/2-oxohepta-3-ene-1,7-dioic acid hydratase in catechol pathway
MRLLTFSTVGNPTPRPGALSGDRVVDLVAASSGQLPHSLLALVQQGAEAERRSRALAEERGRDQNVTHAVSEIVWHAPIVRPPKNVFCVGLNYLAHAHESARMRGKEVQIPDVPVFFTKAPTTVSGPYDDVAVDWSVTSSVDWEVELGVIIGGPGRDIDRRDALGHVFGYTVINDLSARDLQSAHGQWFKGKSLDGFCPIGPVVVTRDELGNPQDQRLRLRVNGVTKQESTTADMIFPVDVLIEWLSKGLTLEAGDIIATGTPEGVGMGRTPPEYLREGDIVETEVEGIGTLRNRIVTSPSPWPRRRAIHSARNGVRGYLRDMRTPP